MPDTPLFAFDYEFHFHHGEPCFATIGAGDEVEEDEHIVRVSLKDADGEVEGQLIIAKEGLNWHKYTRRPLINP